jgi:hypothetical protein
MKSFKNSVKSPRPDVSGPEDYKTHQEAKGV